VTIKILYYPTNAQMYNS